MKTFLRNNSLTLVLLLLFLVSESGQFLTGFAVYNNDRNDRHQPPIAMSHYIVTGHFVEALFENWESEWLQMSAFVLLTVWLKQKGSAESKKLENAEEDEPVDPDKPGAPKVLKRGGFPSVLYRNSLGLTLFGLFLFSVWMHALGGAKVYNEAALANGQSQVSTIGYFGTSQFWFESFQNWQSEFLSIAMMVVLTIFLRQQGSPESKRVDESNEETGR